MHRYLLGLLLPPVAICRYGCAGCCALPISVFWIGGITALTYFLFHAAPEHTWLHQGSLILGVAMIAISVVWTLLTLNRVIRDGCEQSESKNKKFCGGTTTRYSEYEEDPLEEVQRLKKL